MNDHWDYGTTIASRTILVVILLNCHCVEIRRTFNQRIVLIKFRSSFYTIIWSLDSDTSKVSYRSFQEEIVGTANTPSVWKWIGSCPLRIFFPPFSHVRYRSLAMAFLSLFREPEQWCEIIDNLQVALHPLQEWGHDYMTFNGPSLDSKYRIYYITDCWRVSYPCTASTVHPNTLTVGRECGETHTGYVPNKISGDCKWHMHTSLQSESYKNFCGLKAVKNVVLCSSCVVRIVYTCSWHWVLGEWWGFLLWQWPDSEDWYLNQQTFFLIGCPAMSLHASLSLMFRVFEKLYICCLRRNYWLSN